VVDWADMQGNLKSEGEVTPNEPDAPKPAPAAAAAPRRSKPALVADDVVSEPAQAPMRPAQRRRPAPL